MAYELKTKKNNASVAAFLNGVEDDVRRRDAKTINKLMKEVTGEKPVMWGASIVGFGSYDYTYQSGQSGTWMRIGFSPRKSALTLYLLCGSAKEKALLKKLGSHKIGKSCLYIKRLDDVDMDVLREIVERSWKEMENPRTC